jgi:preprotein translocase subunit SecE
MMAVAKEKDRDVRSKDAPRSDKEPPRESRLGRTFREVRAEMRKVVWPTREEATRLTAIVIGVSVVASLFLSAADFIFTFLLSALQNAVAR